MNDVGRRDEINAQSGRHGSAEGKGKDVVGGLAVEAFSCDTVDMGEDEINSILREIIKGRA